MITNDLRRQLLHDCLRKWSSSIDPERLQEAEQVNRQDPTRGFDQTFGKPAIKTYRAFVYHYQLPDKTQQQSSPPSSSSLQQHLQLTADRVARQIEFLRKRHGAHTTDYIRHTDASDVLQEGATMLATTNSTRTCFPLMLLLDNLRSALNVGSLFRTADACGCRQVLTTGITAHPQGSGAEKVAKSALGAERVVVTQHFDTMHQAMAHVRQVHPEYTMVGLETTQQSQLYTTVDYAEYYNSDNNHKRKHGIVLVLGNEVTGIDPEVLPQLDLILEIPMFGTKNSLNVAAVAPVVLFEILRQWGAAVREDES